MDINLSIRLKAAREYLHLSQEYVAKQMDIHRTFLVAIEAGKRKVTSDELKSFAEILAEKFLEYRNCREPVVYPIDPFRV